MAKTRADEIREYVDEHYFKPARERGEKNVTVRAGDVHDRMELSHRQPAVCEALRGNIIQEEYNINLEKEKRGENVTQSHAKNIWYTYKLK